MLKRLAGQTAVYGMSSIVGRFLNYLLTPLYTYQFMASEYGVVTEMYAYLAFFIVLLTFGMETTFFRFAGQSENPLKVYGTALMPVVLAAMVFGIAGVVFSEPIATAIDYPDHPEFISWFAIVVAVDAMAAIPMARLRYENKALAFVGVNLSSIVVNIVLNLFFIGYCKVKYDAGEVNAIVDFCYNPNLGVGYIFIINLVSSVFRGVLLLPKMILGHLRVDPVLLRRMFAYGLPVLVAGIAGFTNENLDRLLLKYLLLDDLGPQQTMAQVGIYGACYKVSILITLFIQAYRYAIEPFFFSQNRQADNREIHARIMRYFVVICMAIFLGIMANIDWVMHFVGEEFREGVVIVPVLLCANILLGVYFNLSFWYKLNDKTIYGAYIAIFGAVVTIVANIIFIPRWGYMGSAWATLTCYASMVLVSYFLGRKLFPVNYPILELTAYAVLTGLVYGLMVTVNWEDGSVKFVFSNLLFLGVLLVFAFRLRPKKIIT